MPGVGFSRHPNQEEVDDDRIHLWKGQGESAAKTYCGTHTVEKELNNKGMTQVTQSQIDEWKRDDRHKQVCEDCVEELDESYSG